MIPIHVEKKYNQHWQDVTKTMTIMTGQHVSHKKISSKAKVGDYTNAKDSMEKMSRVSEIFVHARKFQIVDM